MRDESTRAPKQTVHGVLRDDEVMQARAGESDAVDRGFDSHSGFDRDDSTRSADPPSGTSCDA